MTASYNITYTNGTLEVTQKTLTITADSDTKTYDGTALTKNSYTNTALAEGDAIESVTVTGSQTVAGSSNNVPSAAVIKNGTNNNVTASYNITYTNGTLEVTAKSIGDGSIPATGIVITIDGSDVTVQDGDNTLAGSDFTASKDENDVWTITGINNYSGSAQVIALNLDFYDTGETPTATDEDVKDVAPYQAPKNMVITGKSVYLVTGVTENAVDLLKIDYAPEGVPVLLLDDLDGTPNANGAINNRITVSEFTPTTPADVSSNILKKVTGTGGMEVGFGQVYMFYKGRFVLTSDGTLPTGTYYFDNPNPLSSTSGARLRIVVGRTTDIDDVQFTIHSSQLDEVWYTIDGRRLNGKPTKKGLYIKRSADGQKGSVTVIK